MSLHYPRRQLGLGFRQLFPFFRTNRRENHSLLAFDEGQRSSLLALREVHATRKFQQIDPRSMNVPEILYWGEPQ